MNEQETYQYIEMTPFRGREPVFRGTNIRVSDIIDDLAKGMTTEEILKVHGELTPKHLQATFVYAQTAIRDLERLRLLYAIS
jgi:uncharacterized protein (DUF433 family)